MGERLARSSGPRRLSRHSAVAASKRRPLWLATAGLLVALGVVISWLAAGSLASAAAAKIAGSVQGFVWDYRVNVAVGDPARERPQRERRRFHRRGPDGVELRVRPVGQLSTSPGPIPRTGWHESLGDRVICRVARFRSTVGRRPSRPVSRQGAPSWSHRRAHVRFTAFWWPQCRWASRRRCRPAPTSVLPGPTGQLSWLPKIPAKARTCPTRSARPPCWRS